MAKYSLSERDQERLNQWRYHRPFGDQYERFNRLNKHTRELAKIIMENCPYSRQREIALGKLEMVKMMANAAIACNEVEPKEGGQPHGG